MASKDIYLYDELSLQWEKVATNGDIETVTTNLEEHELELLHTEQGVHGVRFWNNKLEYSDDNGVTWIEIQTGGGGASLPISANDVADTTSRVLVSPSQRSQIDSNSNDLASHTLRIATLESDFQNLSSTDEKVKMNNSDQNAGYLEDKIDNYTIVNTMGKLEVVNLVGLNSTIQELNFLQGVSSNVQQQLDNVTSLVSPSQIVDTDADLPNPVLPSGAVVLVREDASHSNNTTFYISNGTTWDFVDVLDAGIARDFTTNPIDLGTETTGVLQKNKYEKQNAQETPIIDSAGNLTATNVEDALSELFTYANNIKSIANVIGSPLSPSDTSSQLNSKMQQLKDKFATTITNKGIPSYGYSTLDELINRTAFIPNISLTGVKKSLSKLNIIAPYTTQIVLNEYLTVEDLTTTVLKLIGEDSGVVHYTAEYNNGDESSFIFNNEEVVFDGYMQIKDSFTYDLDEVSPAYFESNEIDFSEFIDFGDDSLFNIYDEKVNLKGIKVTDSVVKASGDISISGIKSIDQILTDVIISGNAQLKMAISFDEGLTWDSWNGSSWVKVDIDVITDFKTLGMSASTLSTLNDSEFSIVRDSSDTIRLAYLLSKPSYVDDLKNDKLSLFVTTQGYNEIAPFSDYTYTYDASSKTITYNFTEDGTYSINYVDGI